MTETTNRGGQWEQWNNPEFVERFRDVERSNGPLNEVLFAAARLRPGENVLDIGCGAGGTTFEAAQRVGRDGRVTGFDISAPMLAMASERLQASGVANVGFHQGDAGCDCPPNAPFDAAISRFGVMFFADPPAAFANIRAQLKPGARLVFASWRSPAVNRWFPVEVLARYNTAPPRPAGSPPAPGPFALADEGYVRSVLEAAGFSAVTLSPHGYEWDEPPGPINTLMLGAMQLEDEMKERAIADLEAHQASLIVNGLVHQERNYWIVTASNA